MCIWITVGFQLRPLKSDKNTLWRKKAFSSNLRQQSRIWRVREKLLLLGSISMKTSLEIKKDKLSQSREFRHK